MSGDLSDNGEVESYVRLACLVSEVEERVIPTLLALRNHDNRANFYSVFHPDRDCERHPKYHYSRTIGGLRVIVLDSLVHGYGPGHLGRERLDRMLECRGDVMESTPRYIDQQYGGVAEYVRSQGSTRRPSPVYAQSWYTTCRPRMGLEFGRPRLEFPADAPNFH